MTTFVVYYAPRSISNPRIPPCARDPLLHLTGIAPLLHSAGIAPLLHSTGIAPLLRSTGTDYSTHENMLPTESVVAAVVLSGTMPMNSSDLSAMAAVMQWKMRIAAAKQ